MLHFTEHRLTDWATAKTKLFSLMTAPSPWIFRGMHDAKWTLQTSLERNFQGITPHILSEQSLVTLFLRNAQNHLDFTVVPRNDHLATLALMQHHGAPTRLLDWTRSAYVAAFFAFEGALDPAKECAIWALDIAHFRIRAQEILYDEYNFQLHTAPTNFGERRTFNRLYREVLLDNVPKVIIPAEPFMLNQRLATQQGVFILPGHALIPFADNFAHYTQAELKSCLHKFILPNSIRNQALTDLHYMNINAGSLFPGFDGFARSLGTYLHIEDYLIHP